MAKKKFAVMVLVNCPDPARREEFERWYMHTHLPDLKETAGLIRSRRFKNRVSEDEPSQSMTLYEFEHENPDECVQQLFATASGAFDTGRHIDIFETVGLYQWEEIDPNSLKPLEKVDYPRH